MVENSPEILTIAEAAQYLRISLSSLYKLAQDGKIPAQKVGKHWRFHKQTLTNWIGEGNLNFREHKSHPKDLDFS
jgi:excisionase family DNA binding protein